MKKYQIEIFLCENRYYFDFLAEIICTENNESEFVMVTSGSLTSTSGFWKINTKKNYKTGSVSRKSRRPEGNKKCK